jgi:hypothetical protein
MKDASRLGFTSESVIALPANYINHLYELPTYVSVHLV